MRWQEFSQFEMILAVVYEISKTSIDKKVF